MKLLPQSSQSSKLRQKSHTISTKKPDSLMQELHTRDRAFRELLKLYDLGIPTSQVVALLRELRHQVNEVRHISKRRGRAKGGGQSSKQKGRSAVVSVRDMLLAHCYRLAPDIQPDDVFVKATSQGGCDIHLSSRALGVFPFAIEVKNAEALNIWQALAQAEVNARKKEGNVPAIVFFKRARSPLYVALRAEHFLSALSGLIFSNGRV